MSLFSYGFFKVSWKRFLYDFKRYWFRIQSVEQGKLAPDAQLVTLDRKVIYLKDVLSQCGDMPVILNMGSYT